MSPLFSIFCRLYCIDEVPSPGIVSSLKFEYTFRGASMCVRLTEAEGFSNLETSVLSC